MNGAATDSSHGIMSTRGGRAERATRRSAASLTRGAPGQKVSTARAHSRIFARRVFQLLLPIVAPFLAGAVLGSVVSIVLVAPPTRGGEWQFQGKSSTYWTRALQAPDVHTRADAAFTLGLSDTLPSAVCSHLAKQLADVPDVQEDVRNSLIRLGQRGSCVGETASILGNAADAAARRLAADALRGAGPEARAATRQIVRALADPNPGVRTMAAAALGALHDGADSVQDALSRATEDPHPDVRTAAIDAIAQLPGSAARLSRIILRAARDTSASVRAAAVAALEFIEAPSPQLVGVLMRAQSDPAADVRAAAMASLGRMRVREHRQ
jgi:HEAT repeats/HEAT repeat